MNRLGASIAHKGGFVQPVAVLLLEVLAMGIAVRTRSALYTAEDNLLAGIGLFAAKAFHAEVFGIVEQRASLVLPCSIAVFFYLPGNSRRILAEEPGDVLEGSATIQLLLNVNTVV